MKAQQIEKLLHGVVDNFIKSITDDNIKNIIKNKSFITGGCIPCMLMGEWVNDYDFYFIDIDSANKVKDYFSSKNKKEKEDKSDKFYVKLITDNAVNLSDKIQLITRFVGAPEEVTKNFDWQHIKSYYNCRSENLILTDDIYKFICEKELVYTGSAYPLSSMLRLKKYLKKGWNVSTATMVHIALDISSSLYVMKQDEGVFFDDIGILNKQYTPDYEETQNIKYSVGDILYHLNGVDPLTIQKQLQDKCGENLSVKEIVDILYKRY